MPTLHLYLVYTPPTPRSAARAVVCCAADATIASVLGSVGAQAPPEVHRIGVARHGMPAGRLGYLDYLADELLKAIRALEG